MKLKVLVVDDEPEIRKQLKIALTGYNYEVVTAEAGQEAITVTAQQSPDMIILDIALGSGPDGIEVCQRLREWSNTPIIMLSVRNEEKIKVSALNAGADDYLTKPFGVEELHARMLAIFRRVSVEPTSDSKGEIVVNALRINLVNRLVFIDDEEIHLTRKEYDLLHLLATHSGKFITHQAILNTLWGPDSSDSHYVRVLVNQLRRKLRENPARNIRYILNEPGIGYRFVSLE